MPGIGSNSLGGFDVPEEVMRKYDAAMRAGVRFYILLYPKNTRNDQVWCGPYDVMVDRTPNYAPPPNMAPGQQGESGAFTVKWRTGIDANIWFRVQKRTTTAIAFMPDDRYYHNKMMLAENPWYLIEGLYSLGSGLTPGPEANLEIECIRDVIYHDVPIYRLVDEQGRERDFGWTREEAEEKKKQSQTVFIGAQQHPREVFPLKRCKIVEGTKKAKKDNILELIHRYNGMEGGWTACSEFLNGIRREIDELYQDKMNRIDPSSKKSPVHDVDHKALALEIVRNMTPDQFAAIRGMSSLVGGDPISEESLDQPMADDSLLSDATIGQPAQDQPSNQPQPQMPSAHKFTKNQLSKMRLEDIQKHAQQLGVFDMQDTKPRAIDKILKAQLTPQQTTEEVFT